MGREVSGEMALHQLPQSDGYSAGVVDFCIAKRDI
jgi:hypothetical protein